VVAEVVVFVVAEFVAAAVELVAAHHWSLPNHPVRRADGRVAAVSAVVYCPPYYWYPCGCYFSLAWTLCDFFSKMSMPTAMSESRPVVLVRPLASRCWKCAVAEATIHEEADEVAVEVTMAAEAASHE
jgi:hypothetical protein